MTQDFFDPWDLPPEPGHRWRKPAFSGHPNESAKEAENRLAGEKALGRIASLFSTPGARAKEERKRIAAAIVAEMGGMTLPAAFLLPGLAAALAGQEVKGQAFKEKIKEALLDLLAEGIAEIAGELFEALRKKKTPSLNMPFPRTPARRFE